MKIRRSERLIDLTDYLENHPYQLVPLTFFAQRYQSAKSSISEDITIIKTVFKKRDLGIVETLPGAGGGVRFMPAISRELAAVYLENLREKLADPQRILPGGYLYLSDILGQPNLLRQVGRLIATQYAGQEIDAIMTMATKGIPIAQSAAYYLNVPYVIVRRESKITEGPTLSVNYESGSVHRIEKMELSKRSLPTGSRIIAVDDFMKGGGTISGMHNLVEEFSGKLVGVTVLVESNDARVDQAEKRFPATSLLNLQAISVEQQKLNIELGNYLEVTDFNPEKQIIE
ncbi:pur operon repressor [Lactobacillus sp. DCY120]|uniref:Pur operon repressor n=1 Tax=Bombilactobacillus apium TaxID=2675299 RepID=A0A850R736_9LACO|nr:pur operon repressor [Bombilactobacillus apium]NVY96345.1 pur operon repressor [Bombilactobacillus apium]